MVAAATVVDTTDALYVWEDRPYPGYYLPVGDVTDGVFDEAAVVGRRDGRVRLRWDAADAWFEEDEEVFVHPRDPQTRVDALPSSRLVSVVAGDVAVAESTRCVFVFETGLPRRTYFPKLDVRLDLLVESDTVSRCPYKGTARYWSLHLPDGSVEPDVAWSYPFPVPAVGRIAGLVAFYDERLDVSTAPT